MRILLILITIGLAGCSTTTIHQANNRSLPEVLEQLKISEKKAKTTSWNGGLFPRSPQANNCLTCQVPHSDIAKRLQLKEEELEKREEKILQLFQPNDEALKNLDWFSPEYQKAVRYRSLTAKELRLERAEKANIRFLYLLQEEDHLFCYDPIFLEKLYHIRLEYKKLHLEAEKRLEAEYKSLKREHGQLKAEERIRKLREKELRRQIDLKKNKSPNNPLQDTEPLTILKTDLRKFYKVYHDPFK